MRRSCALLAVLVLACGSDDKKAADAGPDEPDAGDSTDAAQPSTLEDILSDLRQDTEGTMLELSRTEGWPVPLDEGYLVVSLDTSLTKVAGDHDEWAGTNMTLDDGFRYVVLSLAAGSRYKFTDGASWAADPWSRAFHWDNEGLMSQLAPEGAHLERYFQVGDANMQPRLVTVWVPAEPVTHLLYCHDGQNLFAPDAIWGGWKLLDETRPGLMFVGIDNTDARMSEYTHVADNYGGGSIGGSGDDYANFVNTTVRGLIADKYGEPDTIGLMGSSLGGLISLHIADRFEGQYEFAASLSGTLGWGSRGAGVHNETMIERYQEAGHRQDLAIYLDSGGHGDDCQDSDADGIEDDATSAADNYCETRQLEGILVDLGYTYDQDFWHWWDGNAEHNEAAWAARVFRPIDAFMSL